MAVGVRERGGEEVLMDAWSLIVSTMYQLQAWKGNTPPIHLTFFMLGDLARAEAGWKPGMGMEGWRHGGRWGLGHGNGAHEDDAHTATRPVRTG